MIVEEKEHQWHDGFPVLPRGMTVLPWLGWALILSTIMLALWAGKVFAEPLAVGSDQDGTITIYTENCALDEHVAMGNRATWEKNGKVSEGCASYTSGVLLIYRLSDKSLWLFSPKFFRPVVNA